MPTKIEATYKVVTPMFCGGADPKRVELRLPSFKGVLRYWWRALAWAECEGNLELIRKREDTLFGSAEGGQSLVTMRLGEVADGLKRKRMQEGEKLTVARGTTVGAGARYLGYGVMDPTTGKLSRECFRAPFEFRIQMRVRNPGGKSEGTRSRGTVFSLTEALIAVGVFGGMGAKSRKGYGSLVLRSLNVDGESRDTPRSECDLKNHIKKLLHRKGRNEAYPSYTAFSTESRHVLVSNGLNQPLELLDQIGLAVKDSRPSERRHRIAFGLPRNYGNRVVPSDIARRASPIFIHIHECDGKFVAVLSFLPAQFLPKSQSIPDNTELYRPIHDFLERLKEIEGVIEVKP